MLERNPFFDVLCKSLQLAILLLHTVCNSKKGNDCNQRRLTRFFWIVLPPIFTGNQVRVAFYSKL